MANTYNLVTKTDATIDYDDIEVKVTSGPSIAPFSVKTVLELKNQKADLEAQLAVVDAELTAIKLEADKVTTATNKSA